MQHTIAVVFDFDDTLLPDSTSLFLKSRGVDPKEFWSAQPELVERGYDPAMAFLRMFLDSSGEGKPLGKLTNADLRAFGGSLDRTFFKGVTTLPRDLRAITAQHPNIDIQFFIVSGGLVEIIKGSAFVRKNFKAVYGCELESGPNGNLQYIKRCVTFTEKTRYLFEISKGIQKSESEKNPYLVNNDVQEHDRLIPIRNMIYIGDGLTDIPCFSVVQRQGGTAFGVFDPSIERSARKAYLDFLKPRRVTSTHAPRYRQNDELGAFLRVAVAALCSNIALGDHQANRPR